MKNLRRLYSQYNKLWFGGTLPRRVEVEYANLQPERCIGMLTEWTGAPPLIQIDYRLKLKDMESIIKLVMIHEMAHLSLSTQGKSHKGRAPKSHGPKFQATMLKLAKRGALASLW